MKYIVIDNPKWGTKDWGWGGLERIDCSVAEIFDNDSPEEYQSTTLQYLSLHNKEPIRFNVSIKIEVVSEEERELHITYDGRRNRGPIRRFGKGEFVWGTHALNLKRGETNGQSSWRTRDGTEKGPGWKEKEEENLEVGAGRERKAIYAIQRGDQGTFRRDLLEKDGCCALSGETCQESLEAAHIVPAYCGGQEVLSNGVLLRADLHRLFDATPPKFEISPDSGEVSTSGCNYQSFGFRGCRVPEEVRRRIKMALLWRQKNAGRLKRRS